MGHGWHGKQRLWAPECARLVVEVGVPGGAGVLGVGPLPPPEPSQVMPVGHGWHGWHGDEELMSQQLGRGRKEG